MALFFWGTIFFFILFPLSGLLFFGWLFTTKKIFLKILIGIWVVILGLICLLIALAWLSNKTVLEKEDYYGQYVINRDYFCGPQTDWQYNNFRFEIKNNDSIYFYITDREKILKTFKGTITTTQFYSSERLIINMEQPAHHIMTSNPTTYRSAWSFYLVFCSPKFNNVYFKKGQWKPLNK